MVETSDDTLFGVGTSAVRGLLLPRQMIAVPRWCSGVVVLITAFAVLGWVIHNPTLASLVPGGVTMKANTALGLLMSGISLWCLAPVQRGRVATWIGWALAFMVAAIGLLTLLEYSGSAISIDELFVRATTDAGQTATPGRMAVSTAFCLTMMGAALLTLDIAATRFGRISDLCAVIGLIIPLTTVLGYTYSVIPFVGVGQGMQMALHTAVCFVLLDVGIFIVRGHDGIVRTVTSPKAGGVLARRILPYAFIVPLMLGAFRLLGERAGWYNLSLGSAFVAVTTMLVFGGLIWRTAQMLNATDEARERATTALNVEHAARIGAEAARGRAEDAEQRFRLVAEASQLLASSLDVRVILDRLVGLAVPSLADWCVADVREGDGRWHRAAVAHTNPDDAGVAEQLRRTMQQRHDERFGLGGVATPRDTRVVARVDEELLTSLTQNEEQRNVLRALHMRSFVSIPLTTRDRVVGGVTFIRTANANPFSPVDVALLEEVTQRGAIAIDNARLYRGAVAGAQSRTEFLATISHELRTPLTAIMGYGALLEEGITGELTPPQHEQVVHIRRSADHLLELIDEILTFSKLEGGRANVVAESVVIADALEEAAALVQPLAAQRGLVLSVESPLMHMIMETDSTKLRQILVNLLNNAVKFTERGTITLRARPDGNDVIFEVRDTGIGIATEDMGRVFEAFTQVDQRLTRTAGGMGLGLSVAQRLAALLGGDITVASRLGAGSTFFVRLPVSMKVRTSARLRRA